MISSLMSNETNSQLNKLAIGWNTLIKNLNLSTLSKYSKHYIREKTVQIGFVYSNHIKKQL